MAQTLSFDGVDLMSAPYQIRTMPHDSWPTRRFETQPISRDRGVLILDNQFAEKKFTVTGLITGTDQANLEGNIDTAKELFSRTLKNLDIGYGGSVRRYQAYADNVDFSGRDFYHLLFCPFTCEFIIPSGVGFDPTSQSSLHNGITSASYSNSLTMIGSRRAAPVITITFTAASSVTGASFTVNGDKITITNALASSDVLVIDCDIKKVTLNGTEIDYAGIFPRFIVGENDYVVNFSGTSATYNLLITYNPAYL